MVLVMVTLPRLGGRPVKFGLFEPRGRKDVGEKARHFMAEYKAESVKFYEESGRSLQPVAEELDVHAKQLRSWRNEIRAMLGFG